MSIEEALNAPKETESRNRKGDGEILMSERTIKVSHTEPRMGIRLESKYGNVIYLPEAEIDAIMEDIKNLR